MRRAWMLAMTLVLVTGCLGVGNPSEGDDGALAPSIPASGVPVWIPDGAWDPGTTGPWYLPETLSVTVPATIVYVNNDTVEHVTAAASVPPGEREADDHGHHAKGSPGPDHGAHDHGGGASTVFKVTTGPGERVPVELVEPGRYAIHCHPHPWMTMEIVARLASPVAYKVAWTEEIVRFGFEGELNEGERANHPIDLPEGPVARVTATLTWDDAEDDLQDPDGETLLRSDPDRLSVTLATSDGSQASEAGDQARQGHVQAKLPQTDTRPGEVMARDPQQAWELAGGNEPVEPWLAGSLEAMVDVEAAGDTGPFEDTRSSYELTIEVVLATPHPVGPGAGPPADAPGVEHDDHDGHDHEH